MSEASPVRLWFEREGQLLRIRLARPKANILDAAATAALDRAFAGHQSNSHLHGILLDAEGPNFSFGASVQEHLPGACEDMLRSFHGLIRRVAACDVPVLAAIRGQCLGGGLELASACHLIFATPDAMLGQPEIELGVFAPAASCLLPERIGLARAEDMLLSGRRISGAEAAAIGLVTAVAEDPEAAALAYFDRRLAAKSASSLRFAVRAARLGVSERLAASLAELERLYLKELMSSHDAVEGLQAFLARRPVQWRNR